MHHHTHQKTPLHTQGELKDVLDEDDAAAGTLSLYEVGRAGRPSGAQPSSSSLTGALLFSFFPCYLFPFLSCYFPPFFFVL